MKMAEAGASNNGMRDLIIDEAMEKSHKRIDIQFYRAGKCKGLSQMHKVPRFVRFLSALIILFLSFQTFAQGYAAFEAHSRGFGVNGGYIINGVDLKAGFESPVNNHRTNPDIIYGSIGYEIFLSKYKAGNFLITPSVGYSKFHTVNNKDREVNEGDYYGSLELGKNFIVGNSLYGHFGRYYLFSTWSHEVFVGAGLRVFIL